MNKLGKAKERDTKLQKHMDFYQLGPSFKDFHLTKRMSQETKGGRDWEADNKALDGPTPREALPSCQTRVGVGVRVLACWDSRDKWGRRDNKRKELHLLHESMTSMK